jgi:hypothetical protein
MLRLIGPFFVSASELGREIWSTFRGQALTKGYLLALGIFLIAVIFSFWALSPLLYSFVYPLF